MTRPAKPPRSVWVSFASDGFIVNTFRLRRNAILAGERSCVLYVLHRPKRKPAKGKRRAT